MAGVYTQEGSIVAGAMLLDQLSIDRGAGLKLGLFTNSNLGTNLVQAMFATNVTQAATTITSGSANITLAASNTGIKAGQYVFGPGLAPVGGVPATVSTIAGTALTLTNAANVVATTSGTLTFCDPAVQTTAAAAGSGTTQTIASGTGTANGQYVFGIGIPANTTIVSGGGTTTLTLNNTTTAALGATLTFGGVNGGVGVNAQSIAQATFTGYAEVSVTDANWSQVAALGIANFTNSGTNPATFTCTGGTPGLPVYGYYLRTAPTAAGSQPRLLCYSIDPAGPYTFANTNTYNVTPTIPVT